MVTRSGARPGDVVLVTGTIGDAALGLMAEQGRLTVDKADRDALVDRYRLPRPRTHLAAAINAHAHGALDVSDGLAADFGHLCRASQVIGRIEVSRLPLSPAGRRAIQAEPSLIAQVLSGGDDYEVLLTAPADAVPKLHAAATAAGIDLTEVGSIDRADSAGEAHLIDDGGNRLSLEKSGWTHS
jgi:thiamine-monophosphate kinase